MFIFHFLISASDFSVRFYKTLPPVLFGMVMISLGLLSDSRQATGTTVRKDRIPPPIAQAETEGRTPDGLARLDPSAVPVRLLAKKTLEDWYQSAAEKFNAGDYAGAVEDLTQAIKMEPRMASSYYNRGLAYYELGQKEKAIADYQKTVKLKPNFAEAYINMGAARYELGDLVGAIANYDRAIKEKPGVAEAYFSRGLARENLGDGQGALADYDQAIQLNPSDGGAYYNRGRLHQMLGNQDEAATDLQEAARLLELRKKLSPKNGIQE